MFRKIVAIEPVSLVKEAEEELRTYAEEAVFYGDIPADDEEIVRRIGDADGVLVSYTSRIGREVLERCPQVRYVGMCCSLYSEASANVDIAYARERGITVLGIRDYGDRGVVGCGYATVIAQAVSALLCLIYIIRKFDILRLSRQDFSPDLRAVGQLLGMGIPMGLQFSITAIGTIIVQGAVNAFGAVYIAGFSAAGKIQSMVSTIFVSFGATIATYVGQNRGAGNIERVHQGVKVTQILVFVWSAVMIAVIHFAGQYLVRIFVDGSQTDVLNASMVYFKTVAWCYPFWVVFSYTGMRCRDWATAWCPCWAASLSWRPGSPWWRPWSGPSGMLACVSRTRRPGWRRSFPSCPTIFTA